MILKHMMLYRLTSTGTIAVLNDFESLELKLAEKPAKAPEGGQWRCLGFGRPVPGISEQLVYSGAGGANVIALYQHERNLPGATIRKHVAARAKKLMEKEWRDKLFAKEMAQLRDEVTADLLPKSFIKDSVIHMVIINDLLIVGSSSAKKAEDALCVLREALGTLSIKPYALMVPACNWMTGLVKRTFNPDLSAHADDFHCLGSAKLFNEDGSAIALKGADLTSDEVKGYVLLNDFKVNELTIGFGEEMQFTLTDKMIFKGIKFSDTLDAQAKTEADGDAATYFDGSVAIFVGAVIKLVDAINDAVGEERPEISESEDESLADAFDKAFKNIESINGIEVWPKRTEEPVAEEDEDEL